MDENHHQFPSLPENLPVLQASQPSGLVFQLPWTALKLPSSMKNSPMRPRSNWNSPRHVVNDWSTWSGGEFLHPMGALGGWSIQWVGGIGSSCVKVGRKKGGVVRWFDPKITHELIMWRTSILGIGALNGTCCTNFQTSWFFAAFPQLEMWKFLEKNHRCDDWNQLLQVMQFDTPTHQRFGRVIELLVKSLWIIKCQTSRHYMVKLHQWGHGIIPSEPTHQICTFSPNQQPCFTSTYLQTYLLHDMFVIFLNCNICKY